MNYVYTFDALSDFISAVDIPKPDNPASATAWENNDSFCGASRVDAFRMARDGWAQGCDNMVTAMAQARPSIRLSPAFTLDVGGAYPDPSAAAAGAPDCMVNLVPDENKHTKIVRLAVNVWASCAYEPSEFTSYGAAVLSYIDAIETAGARVELTMLCHCKVDDGSKDAYTTTVLLKRAEDHMDIDRLTYCLTHVSMLRRMFFSHMQVAEGVAGRMPGCGYPRNPDEGDVERGVIVVPGINTIKPGSTHLKTPEGCAKHISDMMEDVLMQVGVDLPELAFGAEA